MNVQQNQAGPISPPDTVPVGVPSNPEQSVERFGDVDAMLCAMAVSVLAALGFDETDPNIQDLNFKIIKPNFCCSPYQVCGGPHDTDGCQA